MLGIGLALLAAVASGLAVVLVRKKSDESNVLNTVFTLTSIGNIILWPLALLITNLEAVNFEGVLFFAISGLLAPGIARLLYYKGMETVGASVNSSVFATYPLYSSLFAVLLLNETFSSINFLGIMCIILGAISIERSLRSNAWDKRILKRSLILPVLATLMNALSYIIRKHGLTIYNEPLLGVAIGHAISFLLFFLLSIFPNSVRRSFVSKKDFGLFWKAGAILSFVWILAFSALSYERVSVVTPLLSTEPLFVILFAYVYLKELEHISFKLIISTVLIVFGVVLVGI